MEDPLLVDLRTLHDASPTELQLHAMSNPEPALRPLITELRAVAALVAKPGEQVRVGRIVWTRAQTEAGIFVRRGWLVGAVIGLRWDPSKSTVCEVRIGPLSRASAWAQWLGLASGLAAGIAIAKYALAGLMSPVLAFALALLIGAAIGVGVIFLLIRTGLMMDVAASREIASRLRKEVVEAVRLGTRPKKSKGRRKQKPRKARSDGG